ncbi:Adenine phosphoribosyltransferase [Candidatus Hepatincola sp. Av]
MTTLDLKKYIRTVPNFPNQGILFYDIATLIANPTAWNYAIKQLADIIKPMNIDFLVSLESRGFILASALSVVLNKGLVMVRKPNKLPGSVVSYSYNLEYGKDSFEIQTDILPAESKVVIVDDVLATSGSINAAYELLKQLKITPVAATVLIEISELQGKQKLSIPVKSLLVY